MNFNTANQTFRQLLGNGLTYHVPPFQRDYSWAEDEWDDLWQDMLGLFAEGAEPAHYLGYLVLQSADNRRFDIIDGQQRITTLSLMMLAGMAYLEELVAAGLDAENNRRRKEQLQGSYIGHVDPVTLVPKSKLSLNRHNNRFYQNYLVPLEPLPQRGLNDSEQRLRGGFIWFKEHIQARFEEKPDGGRQFVALIDSLIDRLFFTVITVTDELNAFKVFATLNARGVRLSATDLLKNYLFSLLSAAEVHELELKVLEERWEHLVGLLGSASFPEFLRVFWNSRNRLVRKAELFKTIRRYVGNREQAFALLRDLDNSADVYAALRDPGDASWHGPERAALKQLLMFNVRQPLAMLVACHHRFFNTDRTGFARIVRAVAVISFRYNVICNLQTHEQECLYNGIARQVSEGAYAHPNEVLSALGVVYPDDRQFKAAFSEKEMRTTNSRNKKVVRYILFEIERQRSERSFDVESATYSLEHILPERAGEDWSHIDETRQERLRYRLGNMTLLEAHRNRDIGNAGYEAKREDYRNSDLQLTRAVAEHYDTWDEQKIDARQQQLAKVASAVWRVEFGN